MKNHQKIERITYITSGIILLSIFLMLVVMPGIYFKSLPDAKNPFAIVGMSLAIAIHLLIFIGYRGIIKETRRDGKRRKIGLIVVGVFLIIFGLYYSNGAFAYLNNENIPYVSYLMFTSVICDLAASILIFISLFFKTAKTQEKKNKEERNKK